MLILHVIREHVKDFVGGELGLWVIKVRDPPPLEVVGASHNRGRLPLKEGVKTPLPPQKGWVPLLKVVPSPSNLGQASPL